MYEAKLEEREYFGGVEPDQIERVEIEGRERAVKDRPRSQLRGRESRDDNPRQLRVVAGKIAAGHDWASREDGGEEEEEAQGACLDHWQ